MLVMLAVVVPLNLWLNPDTRTTFWVAIPLLLPLTALVTGFAIVVAAATVMFRDVEHLVATVLLPWFLLTPIFYPFSQMPGIDSHPHVADIVYYGNPVAPFVESIRDPLFFGNWPHLSDVIYVFGMGLALLVFASYFFRRVDDQLAAQL